MTYSYIIKEEGKDPLVDLADKVSEFSLNIGHISRATLQALAQFSKITTTDAYLIDRSLGLNISLLGCLELDFRPLLSHTKKPVMNLAKNLQAG